MVFVMAFLLLSLGFHPKPLSLLVSSSMFLPSPLASSSIYAACELEFNILKPHFFNNNLGYCFHVYMVFGANVVDFNVVFCFSLVAVLLDFNIFNGITRTLYCFTMST